MFSYSIVLICSAMFLMADSITRVVSMYVHPYLRIQYLKLNLYVPQSRVCRHFSFSQLSIQKSNNVSILNYLADYCLKRFKLVSRYQVCWGRISSCEEDMDMDMDISSDSLPVEYQGCREEYNVKKGKRKPYHLPYDMKAVWKIIKWGKGGMIIWGRK